MARWEDAERQLFEDNPELAADLDASEPAYLVAREVLAARAQLGISQAELARRMDTSQSVISRLENMEGSPNLKTVRALAKALDRKLDLRFIDPAEGDRYIDVDDAGVGHDEAATFKVTDLMEALRASVAEGVRDGMALQSSTRLEPSTGQVRVKATRKRPAAKSA